MAVRKTMGERHDLFGMHWMKETFFERRKFGGNERERLEKYQRTKKDDDVRGRESNLTSDTHSHTH